MAEIKASAEAINYNYGEIITPYQLAGQNFDTPIGSFREKARMWRVGTFVSMGLSGILILLLIFQIYQPLHSIMAVQITPKGFVRSISPLTEEYTVPKGVSEQFIKNYIGAFFSKQGLHSLIQKDQEFIQDFSSHTVQKDYLNLLSQLNHNNLSQLIKISEVNLISPNTYQARWSQEITDAMTGEVLEHENYAGQFIVSFKTPQDPVLILQNPFGFHVDDIIWKKIDLDDLDVTDIFLNSADNLNNNSSEASNDQ